MRERDPGGSCAGEGAGVVAGIGLTPDPDVVALVKVGGLVVGLVADIQGIVADPKVCRALA
jgi:hypothetical protein